MSKYILKTASDQYISGTSVLYGMPHLSENIDNAYQFDYDDAIWQMNEICLKVELIKIDK